MQAENGPTRSAFPCSLLWTAWGRTPGRTILSLHAVMAASRLSNKQLVPASIYLVRVSATQGMCCLPAGIRTHAEGTPELRCQPLQGMS